MSSDSNPQLQVSYTFHSPADMLRALAEVLEGAYVAGTLTANNGFGKVLVQDTELEAGLTIRHGHFQLRQNLVRNRKAADSASLLILTFFISDAEAEIVTSTSKSVLSRSSGAINYFLMTNNFESSFTHYGGNDTRMLSIIYSREWIEKSFPNDKEENPLSCAPHEQLFIRDSFDAELMQVVAALSSLFDVKNDSSMHRFQLRAKCYEVLVCIMARLRRLADPHVILRKDEIAAATAASRQLQENITSHACPTLSAMSRRHAMSVSKFSAVFKAMFDISYHQYYQRCRMEKGMELLKEGRQVSETASMLQYAGASKFIAAFKRHYGILPGKVND